MGRRGTRIQGAVRNLAMAAGMAAAAAHSRCTAPPRAFHQKQLNFFKNRHTPISVIHLPPPLYLCLSLLMYILRLLQLVLQPYLSSSEPHIYPILRTHVDFVTVPDKQHPTSWPQVQVVITQECKVGAFEAKPKQTKSTWLVYIFSYFDVTLRRKQCAVAFWRPAPPQILSEERNLIYTDGDGNCNRRMGALIHMKEPMRKRGASIMEERK